MLGSGKAEEKQGDWVVTSSSGLGRVSSVFPPVAAVDKGNVLHVPELQ